MSATLDALAFSSLVAACVAGALVCAASLALGIPISPEVVILAAAGTLVVYNVDRLRDLEQDRLTSPARTAFIEEHRIAILALVVGSAVVAGGSALHLDARIWALCGGALALGLLHRRLKGIQVFKTGYQVAAWLAVVVGLPLLAAEPGDRPELAEVAYVVAVLGLSLIANFIVSDMDAAGSSEAALEPDAGAARRQRRARRAAILLSALAACLALAGSGPLPPLALVPAAEILALLLYRPDERYELVVVDGALALGGFGSLLVR
jgi:hypothetical protein